MTRLNSAPWFALCALAFSMLTSATNARAQEFGALPTLTVEGRAGTFDVSLYEKSTVFLYCKDSPVGIKAEGNVDYRHVIEDKVIVVTVENDQAAPTGMLIAHFGNYTAHVKLGGTPDFDVFQPAYFVRHLSEVEAYERRVNEEASRRTAIYETEKDDLFESEGERRFVNDLARSRQLFPVAERIRTDGQSEISLTVTYGTWVQDKLYLTLELANGPSQPFPVDSVTVYDHADKAFSGRVMAVFPEPDADPSDAVRFLPPKSEARVVIAVDQARTGDFSTTRVEFRDVATNRTAWMAVDEWQHRNPFMAPKSREQIAREHRAKQTAVSVRGLFGGFWTAAGDDLGGLDGTTMAGVGVRVQKGYMSGFAIEGEFAAARAGAAQFDNKSWGGMTGNIDRRATLGRALGGVAMRFGDRYVTSMRVGLGIQVANYDSRFTVGTASIDGPGDGFEIDGIWSVGSSFDARVGEHWLLGAAASFFSAFKAEARSLEAGLYVGYGWN